VTARIQNAKKIVNGILRRRKLDLLSDFTSGSSFTVFEARFG
jgi:hypothetical protein